jgi:hypothetical protein
MRVLPALALLAALLAGCAADEAGPEAPPEATPTTGILRGVVVDAAIRPLAGVAVLVPVPDGAARNSTTGEDGGFAFDGLAPGAYVVTARKAGYLDASVAANVTAGVAEPQAVRLQMEEDALNLPGVDSFVFEGFLQCSATALAARVACNLGETVQPLCGTLAPACSGPLRNATADQFMAVHAVGRPSVRFLQSEMVWEPASSLAASLRAITGSRDPATGEVDDHRPFEGPSPLVMPMDGGVAQGLFIGNGRDLAVRVFSGYVEGTAPPVCLPSPVGCPWGVGVVHEQRFSLYTHVFFGYQPPEGWQFGRDGVPPPPA